MVRREALDADVSFRERERWGDPMAHLARKKFSDMPPASSLTHSQMKKTGAPSAPPHTYQQLPVITNVIGIIKTMTMWSQLDSSA